MKYYKTIYILVLLIVVLSTLTTTAGIFTSGGSGPYQYESIRGQTIPIYGYGLYKDMSAEVAIQGIAQDYVTLFIGIPFLIISLILIRKGSIKGRLFLTGVLGYFLVTYLFYLVMAMFNQFFLAYAFLMGTSFFALVLTMMSFDVNKLKILFNDNAPMKFAGGFLVFNAFMIAFLWLSIVLPPLINGSIYPLQLEHYTTLIVQGMDLGLLLPLSALSGILMIFKKPFGYLIGPIYFIFLSILMTALSAKIIAMGVNGYNIIPVIFIIPTFNLLSIICSVLLFTSIKKSRKEDIYC